MTNQRDFYRLEYPAADRPRLLVDKMEFEVLDISEKGCKFLLPKDIRPAEKMRVFGKLRFHDGRTCPIEGFVLRVFADKNTCILELTVGVPLPIMMEEQRRLINKYKPAE